MNPRCQDCGRAVPKRHPKKICKECLLLKKVNEKLSGSPWIKVMEAPLSHARTIRLLEAAAKEPLCQPHFIHESQMLFLRKRGPKTPP